VFVLVLVLVLVRFYDLNQYLLRVSLLARTRTRTRTRRRRTRRRIQPSHPPQKDQAESSDKRTKDKAERELLINYNRAGRQAVRPSFSFPSIHPILGDPTNLQ